MKVWATPLLALAIAMAEAAPIWAEGPLIDLKLFGEQEIAGGLSACHLALWQQDRDPATDQYAYLLYMPLDEFGGPTEATIEIGQERLQLAETALGYAGPLPWIGYRLYTSADQSTHVIVQIEQAREADSLVTIDDARITVVQPDLPPFVARAKGILGCPDAQEQSDTATAEEPLVGDDPAVSAADRYIGPDGLAFGAAQFLSDSSEVPTAVRAEVAKSAPDACDDPLMLAWAGARYVLNDSFLLWEVPCYLAAYQATSVFAVTENPPAAWATVLTMPALDGEDQATIMSAQVIPERGLLLSLNLGRNAGDCGTYQVFRLIDAPGEVFEIELMEHREKSDCDGVQSDPLDWPLLFTAGD